MSPLTIIFIIIIVIAAVIALVLLIINGISKNLRKKVYGNSEFIKEIEALNSRYSFDEITDINIEQKVEKREYQNNDYALSFINKYIEEHKQELLNKLNACENNRSNYENYKKEYLALENKMTQANNHENIKAPYFMINFYEKSFYRLNMLPCNNIAFNINLSLVFINYSKEEEWFNYSYNFENILNLIK